MQKEDKFILLTKDRYAIVDDEDYDFLSQWKWHINTGYAARMSPLVNKKRSVILMHRIIMSASDDKHVDHINGNRLDNRRDNLRICTRSENMMNREKKCGSSKYKGVHYNKRGKFWRAGITYNNKYYYLGSYVSEIDAAKAYNSAALKYFKQFSRPNILLGVVA